MAYETKFSGNTDKTVILGKEGNPTSIEGYFLGTKVTPDTGYGPGKLHVFQTSEGSVGVWGKTRLNSLLTSDLVGQMTLVTFTGMIASSKKGMRPSFGFKVQHDRQNTIDTSGVDLLAASEPEEDNSDQGLFEEQENTVAYVSTPPVRASLAPKLPDADRRAKVQALLNGKAKTA